MKLHKEKTEIAPGPKCEHISDDIGCTLLVHLPPVAPEVRDFITYQTQRFVQGLIDNLNNCVVPEERIDFAAVDSV